MHTLIICNGFPPSRLLLKQEVQQADLIIGADGGGNILLDHKVKPDVVIGDLDSFQKPDKVNFEVIRDTDQESNDLEKALTYALNKDTTSCTVLGAFGKRMDHSLKNLSVMKQFNSRLNPLVYKDEYQKAFLVQDYFESQLPAGTIISLFPLSGVVEGITTTGLKFPLNNESLINGRRDGTSNENIQPAFSIEVTSGDLVVFIELRPVEQRTSDIES
ncbi:MAG: thiamine diphosphokinase [Balneolaceae bacterium]